MIANYPTFVVLTAVLFLWGTSVALGHLPPALLLLPGFLWFLRLTIASRREVARGIAPHWFESGSQTEENFDLSKFFANAGGGAFLISALSGAVYLYAQSRLPAGEFKALELRYGAPVVIQGIAECDAPNAVSSARKETQPGGTQTSGVSDSTKTSMPMQVSPRMFNRSTANHAGELVSLRVHATDIVFPVRRAACGIVPVFVSHRTLTRCGIATIPDGAVVSIQARPRYPPVCNREQCIFDKRTRLYCDRIWLRAQLPSDALAIAQAIAQKNSKRAGSVIDDARARMVAVHKQALGVDIGCLLASMVLGDKAVKLDKSVVLLFRNVGLSHVLAASGFNLTVVVMMTYFVMRLIARSTAVINVVCLVTTFAYVCLAGASASVMRAAIMCAIVLSINFTRRRVHYLSALSLALIVTIVADPSSITDVGLQLSYGATFGLMVVAKPLTRLLCGETEGVKKWFGETIAVVLASQSAVLPIQLVYFRQFSLMFIPANLVTAPLLAPVTILGFASSTLALFTAAPAWFAVPITTVCGLVDLLTALPLRFMLETVRYLASFDAAMIRTPQPEPLAVTAYVCSWFLLVYALNSQRFRVAATICYAATIVFLF